MLTKGEFETRYAERIDLNVAKGAIFSDDRRHRYALWRVWNHQLPVLLFIGLNPSKAGESVDDPTVTQVLHRAYVDHFGGLLIGNLYSLVSTDPKVLLDGEGADPLTDYYLKKMIDLSSQQFCGWGSFSQVWKRWEVVLPMLTKPVCIGVNKDGQPKHPLRVSYSEHFREYKG